MGGEGVGYLGLGTWWNRTQNHLTLTSFSEYKNTFKKATKKKPTK